MTDVWVVLGEAIESPSEPLAVFENEPTPLDLFQVCRGSWYTPDELTIERMTVQPTASPEALAVDKLARLGISFGMSEDVARSTAERVAPRFKGGKK